jgi:SET domain-containing protein
MKTATINELRNSAEINEIQNTDNLDSILFPKCSFLQKNAKHY